MAFQIESALLNALISYWEGRDQLSHPTGSEEKLPLAG